MTHEPAASARARRLRERRARGVAMVALVEVGQGGLGLLVSNGLLKEHQTRSYVRKLVTELSGGVFGYLDSVLERHSFDEFGELI